MENRLKIQLKQQWKYVMLVSVAVISLMLFSLVMAWRAQASDSVSSQQVSKNGTIKLEFYYSGSSLSDAISAANLFADLLSQETGLTIQASVSSCEIEIIKHLGTDQTDIASIGQYAYVHGNTTYGIQARLVNERFGLPYFRSQINVPAAKGYTGIGDLQNTKFSSAHPNSRSGYYVPYLMILNATGKTPDEFFSEITFVGSHEQVIRDVYSGVADCGATFEDARANVVGDYPDVYSVVEVLAYSDHIPNDPWAFRSGLDAALIQNVSDGIIAVAGTPQGGAALSTILGSSFTGIEKIPDSAYDIFRDMVSQFGLDLVPCIKNYIPLINKNS
jgi:phosphonate transport system substrate-binding protein